MRSTVIRHDVAMLAFDWPALLGHRYAIKSYWDPGRLNLALLFNSSVHMFDQISNAVRELDHFSLSLDVEIDCAITCGSTIDRFFQA